MPGSLRARSIFGGAFVRGVAADKRTAENNGALQNPA